MRSGIALDLGFTHLVQRFDLHLRVFGPELDEHELTTRLDGAEDAGQHFLRKRMLQPTAFCRPDSQVTRARANVSHHHGGLGLKCRQQQIGTFFALALFTLNPRGARPAHDASDVAAHVAFADAIGAGKHAGVALGGLNASACVSVAVHSSMAASTVAATLRAIPSMVHTSRPKKPPPPIPMGYISAVPTRSRCAA